MKRRTVWRSLGLGLVALAAVGVATLDTVDVRPYFQQPYYEAARARVQQATAVPVAHGPLFAGFGRAKLTPRIGAARDEPARGEFRKVPLAGYGARHGRPATGAHDDLMVKAVALRVEDRTVVMVAMDELIVPAEVTSLIVRDVASRCGLQRDQIYLGATHTHAGLGGWGEGRVAATFAGGFVPGLREWIAGEAVQAIAAALQDLRPATIAQGRFAAPEFVRNRLVGEAGTTDPEFALAVVEQSGGRRAVLGSFAAHATVLSADNMEFSSDYPGQWQREVEAAGVDLAVFFAGAVASHGPVAGDKAFAGVERMGAALATRTIEAMRGLTPRADIDFAAATAEIALPEFNVRVADDVRLRPWVVRQLLPSDQRPVIQAVRLDRAVWFSTPCDYSGELALRLKHALRQRDADAVVTSFNGAYLGYVVPMKYYHLPAYESRTMSFYGPYMADYLNDLLGAMAIRLTNDRRPAR